MTRAFKISAIGLIIIGTGLTASGQKNAKINDSLFVADKADFKGFVGLKLDDAYQNRILGQDLSRLIEPFKLRNEDRCWQTEFWGKWITSAILAYRCKPTPELKRRLDEAVAKLLATQTPDGYIGNYAPDKHLQQWDIWGRKYCMLGLVAYYDLTGDRRSLNAARASADFLMKELNDSNTKIVQCGNHRGMAATSVLEPITQLYVRTKDPRYLQFAEEIVKQWESLQGPQLIAKSKINVAERFPKPKDWWGYEQGQKAYEMMSCYEGLLEHYRITGKQIYRTAVEDVWQNIKETEINIVGSGSSMECWFGGKNVQQFISKHYQETCVTATWIKLNQQLLRLTGNAKYADAIEQSFYNGLLGSMKRNGSSWAKYSPIVGIRSEGEDQCHMGLNCCVASGPRALFTIPLTAVMRSKDGARVNFYNRGTYLLKGEKQKSIELVQDTDYPLNGIIKITVNVSKPQIFTLSMRIPEWSAKTALTVNGKEITNVNPGGYAGINRKWQKGDVVSLSLDMRGRVQSTGSQTEYLAIARGPMVLGRDIRLTGSIDIDESITPVLLKDGYVDLEPVKPVSGIWMAFRVPCLAGSYREEESSKPQDLLFCDYMSSGNTFAENSRFRIWLPQLLDPSH